MNFPTAFDQLITKIAEDAFPIKTISNFDDEFNYNAYVREQKAQRTLAKHFMTVAFTTPGLAEAAGYVKVDRCKICDGTGVLAGILYASQVLHITGYQLCPTCHGG